MMTTNNHKSVVYYKTLADFIVDLKSAESLGSADTAMRMLLYQCTGTRDMCCWPKIEVSAYADTYIFYFRDSENDTDDENLQCTPAALCASALAVTTPSTSAMHQHWPTSLAHARHRYTRKVKTFSDMCKVLKAFAKYRSHMLELKIKEAQVHIAHDERSLNMFKQFSI
jgi:hypothetical protein